MSKSAVSRPLQRISGDTISSVVTAIAIGVVGISFAIFIIGPRASPLDTSWFGENIAQSNLGWMFFRNEAHLTFPLGWSSAIAFPFGEPIAYFDSIPLVATMFWPARHILPPDFQYSGLYFALNCTLQLYFGYRICRRLSGNNRLAAMAGGLLFLTAPPFLMQMSVGQVTLTSQWLVLAALDIFFAATPRVSKPRSIGSVILCFLVGGIHPYLTFMVVLVLGAANLRALLMTEQGDEAALKSRIFYSAFWFCTSVAAAVASLTIFGFLRPGGSLSYAAGRYGHRSMNLLAPLDPMLPGALLLKPLPISEAGQYEGSNYLGLGVIVLGILALAYRPSAAKKLVTREAVAAWVVVGVSLLLALSNKATAGSLILYDIPLPPWLFSILSVLRASGRLFWPAYYLILCGVIAAACGIFSGRKLALALSAVVLLQFADLRGLYAAIHARLESWSSSVFTDGAPWQTLGRAHRHLVVIPPWQCDEFHSPGGERGFWIFGKLAAQHNMTINSFYAARSDREQQDFFCNRQPAILMQEGLDENTAYVFANIAEVLPLKLRGHYCRPVDGVILCAIDAGREGVSDSLLGNIPVSRPGQ